MSFPLILASSSPRRLELLSQIGIVPSQVLPADIDESPLPKETFTSLPLRLAKEKALTIAAKVTDAWIIAADTIVVCGTRLLPKADTPEMVRECLQTLSGKKHKVFTGVAIIKKHSLTELTLRIRLVKTSVSFKRLHPEEIEWFVNSQEGIGKAGGYGAQGKASIFMKSIQGSYTNIVGLPLYETASLLTGMGFQWRGVKELRVANLS